MFVRVEYGVNVMRKLMIVTVMGAFALSTLAVTPTLAATQCRDAKGKFIKCATTAAPKPATKCRDPKGKFIKCPAK